MDEGPRIASSVKQHRKRARLTQLELARRLGISRQALGAIETGLQVPSTLTSLRLSQVLSCRVEDLFELSPPDGVRAALAPTSDGSSWRARRVTVGRCAERWVAHPLSDGAAAAADGVVRRHSGTRATVEPLADVEEWQHNALIAGCAPLLGAFAERATRRHPEARVTWLPSNSLRALELLRDDLVHVAGVHVAEPPAAAEPAVGPTALLRKHLPGRSLLIVNLTRWRQGLLVPRGNPAGVHEPRDLLRKKLRVACREPGSSAHALLQRLLGGDAARMPTGPRAFGHAEVARLIRAGAADAGVAIESVAIAEGLRFLPLSEERFDLVLPRELAAEGPALHLLEALHERGFRREAASLPGYDASLAGQVTPLDLSSAEPPPAV